MFSDRSKKDLLLQPQSNFGKVHVGTIVFLITGKSNLKETFSSKNKVHTLIQIRIKLKALTQVWKSMLGQLNLEDKWKLNYSRNTASNMCTGWYLKETRKFIAMIQFLNPFLGQSKFGKKEIKFERKRV